jgi:hypothetical protein
VFLPWIVVWHVTGIPMRKRDLYEDSVEARVPADDIPDATLARDPEELADHRVAQIEVDKRDV